MLAPCRDTGYDLPKKHAVFRSTVAWSPPLLSTEWQSEVGDRGQRGKVNLTFRYFKMSNRV